MNASQMLCFAGLALFMLGLLNGLAIPRMRAADWALGPPDGRSGRTFLIAVG